MDERVNPCLSCHYARMRKDICGIYCAGEFFKEKDGSCSHYEYWRQKKPKRTGPDAALLEEAGFEMWVLSIIHYATRSVQLLPRAIYNGIELCIFMYMADRLKSQRTHIQGTDKSDPLILRVAFSIFPGGHLWRAYSRS